MKKEYRIYREEIYFHITVNKAEGSMVSTKIVLTGIAALLCLTALSCSDNSAGANPTNGPNASAGTVTDADGNVYTTVTIGHQVWTVENLRVTKYNDGSAIPLDTSTATWFNDTTPKYCFYNNTTNSDSIKKYGALYNWYVLNPANSKKIAPAGWHVPTDAEWDTLQNHLIAKGYNWDGTTDSNKIAKSLAAKTDWNKDSTAGTIGCDLTKNNSSGFSALPGGSRNNLGAFSGQSGYGNLWSATGIVALRAWFRYLSYDGSSLGRYYGFNGSGYSVRLLKD